MNNVPKNILTARDDIAHIDEQILTLWSKRIALVDDIIKEKQTAGIPIDDYIREAMLWQKWQESISLELKDMPASLFIAQTGSSKLLQRQKQGMPGNVYIIGMPASGKTSIGLNVAKNLHKPFVDIDKAIEELCGMNIVDIFSLEGENSFRVKESTTLLSIALSVNGAIISCGGGIIVRPINVSLMHSSGKIIFLLRDFEHCAAHLRNKNLPLISRPDDWQKLWQEREQLYRDAAEYIVEGNNAEDQILSIVKQIWA